MDPYAPPRADLPDAAAPAASWWTAPLVLGIAGIVLFWGTILGAIAAGGGPPQGRVAVIVGSIVVLSIVVHLVGAVIALASRRGHWVVGLVINALPLALIAGIYVLGIRAGK